MKSQLNRFMFGLTAMVLTGATPLVNGAPGQIDRSSTADAAPAPRALFGPADGLTHSQPLAAGHALRERQTWVDLDRLLDATPGERFLINLFGDASFTGIVEQRAGRLVGGSLLHHPGGSFQFVVNPQATAGSVRVPGVGVFRVQASTPGTGSIVQLDEAAMPGCDGSVDPGVLPEIEFDPHAGVRDDGSLIDVLVVYTQHARSAMGGTAAIEAEIDLAVAAANRAYSNSSIGFQIRLVHAAEVSYNESGGFIDHLNRLTDTNDGWMDSVHDLRDAHGADMVALLVDDPGGCGIAWGMGSLSPSFASSAFSVTNWSCATGNLTFAHELGHNMGACHALGDGGGCGVGLLFSYSNGHRFWGDSGTRWRTVMAYSPGTRIEQFSNPDVIIDGQPSGVPVGSPDEAHNAQTLNLSASTVANFRQSISCPADLNGDGFVNIADVTAFIDAFIAGDALADINNDGFINIADVTGFIDAFQAGC